MVCLRLIHWTKLDHYADWFVWTVPSTDSDCLMCGLSAIDPLDKTTDHYADWFVWTVPSTDSDCLMCGLSAIDPLDKTRPLC